MPGLDPGIHLLRKKNPLEDDGLQRTSGLPVVRTNECRKSGEPTCGVKPGNDEGWVSANSRWYNAGCSSPFAVRRAVDP
jgi:hypothetical protein